MALLAERGADPACSRRWAEHAVIDPLLASAGAELRALAADRRRGERASGWRRRPRGCATRSAPTSRTRRVTAWRRCRST